MKFTEEPVKGSSDVQKRLEVAASLVGLEGRDLGPLLPPERGWLRCDAGGTPAPAVLGSAALPAPFLLRPTLPAM